jgi:hypothetical protein
MNASVSSRRTMAVATKLASPASCSIALLVAAFVVLSTPAQALNDNCKDVRISVFNDHPVEIKVTKIEYRDFDKDDKWRSEAFIDRKIATTKGYQFVQNLERVKNDDTMIRITYKENEGGSRWSSDRIVTGSKHNCSEGEYNRIHLPGPSVYDQP